MGEVVTAANMNTYISDDLTYLKAILDGTSNQDVTIAAARAFKHGTLRVVRGDPTTNQHVECGQATAPMGSPGTVAVNFTTAFNAAPKVVICPLNSHAMSAIAVTSVDVDHFDVHNDVGDTDYPFMWVAVGADA